MGNGNVTVTALPNSTTVGRSGGLAIAGHAVAVEQDGLAACSYEIDPGNGSIDSDGGPGGFAVRASPHCHWTALSTEPWLQVTGGQEGAGDGAVSYVAGRNPDPAPREASIQVADRTFLLAQRGDEDACSYSVAPVTFTPCMAWSAELTSAVATQVGCPWDASSDVPWLTVTRGASGVGPGVIGFIGSDNYDRPRTGVVRVRWPAPTAGQNIQIDQAGCLYGVSPGAFALGASGGTAAFDVLQQSDPLLCGGPLQDRCVWTAVSSATWISITTSMPRSGDVRVTFAVATNPGPAVRSGTIAVRDQLVHVTQAGN